MGTLKCKTCIYRQKGNLDLFHKLLYFCKKRRIKIGSEKTENSVNFMSLSKKAIDNVEYF